MTLPQGMDAVDNFREVLLLVQVSEFKNEALSKNRHQKVNEESDGWCLPLVAQRV